MVDLFNNINEKNKEKLLKSLEASTITIKKNNNIFTYINNENVIGIVEDGYLEIIRNEYDGTKTIIEQLEENSIFGNFISSINSNEFDIIAKEDSKIIFIDYDEILNYTDINFKIYNQFMKNLLQIISLKVSEKNDRIKILAQKTIRNKLLEYFDIESNKNKSKNIYLKSTFTNLAEYLAVDRSSMQRELKNLKDEGFIEIKSKKITLLY